MADTPERPAGSEVMRHNRAKEAFARAADLAPGARETFLDDYCAGDEELRREVESLLDRADEAVTADLADAVTAPVEGDRLVGGRLGHYSIKRVIASGGMGVVYEALQEQPRRVVALKVMKRGISSRSAMRRFEYESQVLARLRHSGIAQIYEAGVHEEGGERVPFFAMEYIPGAQPITEYANGKQLGARERLDLFARVCDAVQHGHGKGIIHRDLKPSNILVDSSGQPKIIDFGVARSTDSDLAVTTLQTDVGQLIGTIQYMSPEQCSADPTDLDTRSDVYALGVVLYELLCGKPPYDVSRAAVFEATRVIKESAPARPSTIHKTLRGDIETVILKALEKDRDRRYRSAAELGADLRHYLSNEAISAQPPSLAYQVQVFARRHRAAFRAAVVTVSALVLGLIATSSAAGWAMHERRAAVKAESAAQESADWMQYLRLLGTARVAHRNFDFDTMRSQLASAPEHYHNAWEWEYLQHAKSWHPDLRLEAGSGIIYSLAFHPQGKQLAIGSSDGTVRLWDTLNWQEHETVWEHGSQIGALSYSDDGKLLGAAAMDGAIVILDAETGEIVLERFVEKCTALVFRPGTHQFAVASRSGLLRIEDVSAPGTHVDIAIESAVLSLAFSRDGSRLAGGMEGRALVWDATSWGAPIRTCSPVFGSALAVAFGAGNTSLTIATNGNGFFAWNLESGDWFASPDRDSLISLAVSPDGSRVATGSFSSFGEGEHYVKIWDAEYGQFLFGLHCMVQVTPSVAFSPDGNLLAAGLTEGRVFIWSRNEMDVVPAKPVASPAPPAGTTELAMICVPANTPYNNGSMPVAGQLQFEIQSPFSFQAPDGEMVNSDGPTLVLTAPQNAQDTEGERLCVAVTSLSPDSISALIDRLSELLEIRGDDGSAMPRVYTASLRPAPADFRRMRAGRIDLPESVRWRVDVGVSRPDDGSDGDSVMVLGLAEPDRPAHWVQVRMNRAAARQLLEELKELAKD